MLLLPARLGGHGASDQLRQLAGGLNGGILPYPDDGGGNGPGVALLAVLPQDPLQLLLAPAVHHIPGGEGSRLIHAHIQRGVLEIGEAPAAVVQLGG